MLATSTTALSKRERDALLRIVKERFKLVSEQLVQREQEVRTRIREEIESEYETIVTKAQAEGEKLVIEFEAIRKKGEALTKKYKDQGVQPGQTQYDHFYTHKLVEETRNGVINNEWGPTDLGKKVEAAYQHLRSARGSATLDLRAQELQLTEELLISTLEGTEAKAFLDKIPTIDSILPLPNGDIRKAIEAAGSEK